jgi:UDP-glucose 4-epimerase
MNVLVTGCAGFIGRFVCAELNSRGVRVRGAVLAGQPAPFGVSETHEWEMTDLDADWRPMLAGIDVVIHLAARVHVMHETAEDALAEFRKSNVVPVVRLARQAAESGVRRFVFLSTIGIHGEGQGLDYKGSGYAEDDIPAPRNPYSVSKLEAETELQKIAQETGLEVVRVRAPLVYGPEAPGNFGKLAGLVRSKAPLPFKGVHSRRTMIGAENLAAFLALAAEHPRAANDLFLATDLEEVTTEEMIEVMVEGAELKKRLRSAPRGLIHSFAKAAKKERMFLQLWGDIVVDGSKARRELDWDPPVSVRDGLLRSM